MAGLNHVAVKTHGQVGTAAEWNDDHQQKGNHDCEKFQHLNHVIENRTTFPAGPVEGQIIYRSDQHTLYHWNGTTWVPVISPVTIIVAADGSGVTTDIQEGIDMLPAAGGVVFIKEGTYNITAAITVDTNNVTLRGFGRAAKIVSLGDHIMIWINAHDCLIQELWLYGSGAVNVTNTGIRFGTDASFDYFRNGIVKDCVIENCGEYGIKTYYCLHASVMNNYVKDCVKSNIHINSDQYDVVSGNYSRDSGEDGIELHITLESVISNNQCVYNDRDGIGMWLDWYECENNIVGNVCNDNAGHGIYGRFFINISITANSCWDNFGSGIFIEDALDSVISANICTENDFGNTSTYSGIDLWDDCDNNIVTGNNCQSNDEYGINIGGDGSGDCDRNIVTSNMCMFNATGQINDLGTNTLPNGAMGTNNLALDDHNIIA